MKAIFLILMVVASTAVFGQYVKFDSTKLKPTVIDEFDIKLSTLQNWEETDTSSYQIVSKYTLKQQLVYDSICKVRGHVPGGTCTTTAAYCPPYLVENDTISYMVYPACNYIRYTCQRCGQYISEREKETITVIWRKSK